MSELDENKKYILDPLSTIIKLAILSKKNIGTKICVYNNILHIQEIGIFQPLVRFIYSNNKIDIQYLYNPIHLACKHFLHINKDIKKIFISAQNGIKKLIQTYKEHLIIVHTLFLYYNIIENHLNENFNDKLFIVDSLSEYYSDNFVEKINLLWSCDKIKIILEMIQFINNESELDNSIRCLEEFMIIIDDNIKKLI